MNGRSNQSDGHLVRCVEKCIKLDFSGRSGNISKRLISGVREDFLLKRDACDRQSEKATHAGGRLSGALVWRMAHRRTGGWGGEHSEVTSSRRWS